jgi:uncharacterized protein YaiI (UPF0178 family)
MEELRASGVETSGPKPFSQGDSKAFASQLDRFLSQAKKSDRPSETTETPRET